MGYKFKRKWGYLEKCPNTSSEFSYISFLSSFGERGNFRTSIIIP
jgi:hypothetical protein